MRHRVPLRHNAASDDLGSSRRPREDGRGSPALRPQSPCTARPQGSRAHPPLCRWHHAYQPVAHSSHSGSEIHSLVPGGEGRDCGEEAREHPKIQGCCSCSLRGRLGPRGGPPPSLALRVEAELCTQRLPSPPAAWMSQPPALPPTVVGRRKLGSSRGGPASFR